MADSIKSVDVPSVHGMVALNPDGSAIGTPVGGATSDNQTNGSQKTQIVDAGGEVATVTGGKLDVNATASLAGESIPATGATTAVSVQVVDGSGNQISSFGGGTQYADGAVRGTATGTIAMGDDGTNIQSIHVDSSGDLQVDVLSSALPTGAATAANQQTDALTDTELRATPVVVDLGANNDITVTSGSITANAGTNLNTSALALESGGNLATIAGDTTSIDGKLPALGQALEAASVPVVLPATQIATLTPPAAITGFATSAKQDTIIDHVDGLETSAATIAGAVSGTEMQVDVLTMPTTTVQATNLDIRDLSNASDSVAAVQSGTWTVQPGNTANTTAWKVDGSAVTQPVSGTVTANATLAAETTKVIGTVNIAAAQTLATVTTVGAVTGITNALPAGTNAIGKLAANSGVDIGDVDVTSLTGGTIAHDSADSGNPIKIGGRAINAEITAVANNDRSDFVTDLVGKQIVMPYANPENFVSGAITSAMTGTTSTSLIAAPAAGLRNYITTIIVSNAHASVGTDVVIQDGNAGTTLMTIPAAAVYGGAVINLPVPLRQPTTATAIYCANVTTGASTKVSAVGYKGV